MKIAQTTIVIKKKKIAAKIALNNSPEKNTSLHVAGRSMYGVQVHQYQSCDIVMLMLSLDSQLIAIINSMVCEIVACVILNVENGLEPEKIHLFR